MGLNREEISNIISKILIGLIIFIILFCISGTILTWYNSKVNNQNQIVQDFAVELMKGNKSFEDIKILEVSSDIKESFKTYYNDTFYSEDDVIVVCDNILEVDNIANKVQELGEEFYNNDVFDYESYYNKLYEIGILSIECSNDDISGVFDNSVNTELSGFYTLYHPDKQSDVEYKIENNQLFVKVKDLNFVQGYSSVIYKGFEFPIYRDALDKNIIYEIQKSSKYQSIYETGVSKEKNSREVYYSDELGNKYVIAFEYRFGKIVKVVF